MNQMVVVKYDKGILIGEDMKIDGNESFINSIVKAEGNNYDVAMGTIGDVRDINLVENYFTDILGVKSFREVKNLLNEEYIVKHIIPNLFKVLRENHRLQNKDGIEKSLSQYILCDNEQIYIIASDGALYRYNKYYEIDNYPSILRYYPEEIRAGKSLTFVDLPLYK